MSYVRFGNKQVAEMLALATDIAALPPVTLLRLDGILRGLCRLVDAPSGVGYEFGSVGSLGAFRQRCLVRCGKETCPPIELGLPDPAMAEGTTTVPGLRFLRLDKWVRQTRGSRTIISVRRCAETALCLAWCRAENASPFSNMDVAIVDAMVRSPWLAAAAPAAPPALISTRQQQVLALLKSGCCEKETAAQLDLSIHTVHTHVKNLYRRLGVSTRGELLSLWLC